MSLNYSDATISLQIEEQVQKFVRKDGQKFIDFLQTYYDWMERKFVILTLSSETAISGEDLMGKTVSQIMTNFSLESEADKDSLQTEDGFLVQTEDMQEIPLEIKFISYIPFNNSVSEGIYGERLIVFAEYISGTLKENTIIYQMNNDYMFIGSLVGYNFTVDAHSGSYIYISSFIDVKSPINVINNLESSQEIDYVLDKKNVVYNPFYINAWKELMSGFPLSLNFEYDNSIKDIIVKQIKDFYKSKGSFKSFKYMFKILYNEDLTVGTDLYSDGLFSYVVKSDYASAQTELLTDIKRTIHPVGYNVSVIPK